MPKIDTGLFKCKNCNHTLNCHELRPTVREGMKRFCAAEVLPKVCGCPGWEDVAASGMVV